MSGLIGRGIVSKSGIIDGQIGGFEVDSWRYTTTSGSNPIIFDDDMERTDVNNFTHIGDGMSFSSGIFTFPTTGIWKVSFQWYGYSTGANRYCFAVIYNSSNSGSSWNPTGVAKTAIPDIGEYGHASCFTSGYVRVSDVSTYRVKFFHDHDSSGATVTPQGSTTENTTYMLFERVGELP